MPSDLLTDRQCRYAQPLAKAYKLIDGKGLFLLVQPSGQKLWRLRFRHEGRDTMLGLGSFDDFSLAEARDWRNEQRKLIAKSVHPAHQRREEEESANEEKRLIFADVAERFRSKHRATWSPTHLRDVDRMIGQLVPAFGGKAAQLVDNKGLPTSSPGKARKRIPASGGKALAAITTADIRKLLDSTCARGAITYAHDVRTYFSAILRYANSERPHTKQIPDPAQFVSVDVAPPPESHAHLQPQEIGLFLRALAQANENPAKALPTTLRAARFVLLTAARTGEMRAARWSEIDMAARVWRLAPNRMKANRAHVVPLSTQVVALLNAQRAETGDDGLIFPSPADPKQPLSENALLALFGRIGYRNRMTGHGARSVFSTWAHENAAKEGWTSDAVELALAHAPGNAVKMSYMHTTLLTERARMLQKWADFLDAEEAKASGANVIALERAKG